MSLGIAENLHVVNQIVERGLCVRCGACEPACPVDIIRFDDRGFPYITDEEECLRGCTRCIKVCPGEEVDYGALDDDMFGQSPHPSSITGFARRAVVSHSASEETRYAGASGGFVTQLLAHMLQTGEIDGALVLGTSSEGRWKQEPFVARSVEDLERAAKSKYITVPFLRPLEELERVEGQYAIVALPCYIHAIRKYQQVSPALRKRIKLVIGLYCNVVFEPHLYEEACALAGLDPDDVEDFRFRHGDWPGGVTAKLRDGTERKILKLEEMKDEFNLLKLFYTAPRCTACTDFSGEYSDLSVGDPWLRGSDGSYLFDDGWTSVLVRTEAGDEAVRRAEADGALEVTEIPLETWMVNFEFSGRYKRDFVPKLNTLRGMAGLPTPRYGREIARGGPKGWVTTALRWLIRSLARWRWFRVLGITLAQTRPSLAFLRWNRARKASKYVERYDRRLSFVRTLVPLTPRAGANGAGASNGAGRGSAGGNGAGASQAASNGGTARGGPAGSG